MIVLIAIHAYLLMRSDLYRWFIDDNENSHNSNDNNDSDYTYDDITMIKLAVQRV